MRNNEAEGVPAINRIQGIHVGSGDFNLPKFIPVRSWRDYCKNVLDPLGTSTPLKLFLEHCRVNLDHQLRFSRNEISGNGFPHLLIGKPSINVLDQEYPSTLTEAEGKIRAFADETGLKTRFPRINKDEGRIQRRPVSRNVADSGSIARERINMRIAKPSSSNPLCTSWPIYNKGKLIGDIFLIPLEIENETIPKPLPLEWVMGTMVLVSDRKKDIDYRRRKNLAAKSGTRFVIEIEASPSFITSEMDLEVMPSVIEGVRVMAHNSQNRSGGLNQSGNNTQHWQVVFSEGDQDNVPRYKRIILGDPLKTSLKGKK